MYKRVYTFKELMVLFNKSKDVTRLYIDRFAIQKKRIVENNKTKVVYVMPYAKIKEVQEFLKGMEDKDARRRWHRESKKAD